MFIEPECLVCIYNQALKTSKLIGCDKENIKEILNDTNNIFTKYDFNVTPPFVVKDVYHNISKKTDTKDPLESIKEKSTKEALKYVDFIWNKIKNSDDELLSAIRASIAGNVIDFGAKVQFDLKETIEEIFEKKFGVFDYEELKKDLNSARNIMLVGDNAGEHVFDKILLQVLKNKYPNKEFVYVVRGKPVINDVTLKEAKEIGINEICEIVDSGVDTPGLDIKRANESFLKRFYETDLILAKGMGNYETLYGNNLQNSYFLFKIKCDVIAKSLEKEVGDIALLKNIWNKQ